MDFTSWMPSFALDDYRTVLRRFRELGYTASEVTKLSRCKPTSCSLFLRHDIDVAPALCLPMAELEHQEGVRSTYYVLFSALYNPFEAESKAALIRLVELGHELGVHYDLSMYPAHDRMASLEWLRHEAGLLQRITGKLAVTHCMHNPSLTGGEDPLLSAPGFVHPHAAEYKETVSYISDSCRAFRDATLADFLSGRRAGNLLFNTHAELWLDGHQPDRLAYLRDTLFPKVSESMQALYFGLTQSVWESVPSGKAHDARIGLTRPSSLSSTNH
jgi:hypothetical protein